MGDLTKKAEQLETAIQETAFEGIQARREYSVGVRLIEIAEDVSRVSDALADIEGATPPVEQESTSAFDERPGTAALLE